jgi:hypothetical protein
VHWPKAAVRCGAKAGQISGVLRLAAARMTDRPMVLSAVFDIGKLSPAAVATAANNPYKSLIVFIALALSRGGIGMPCDFHECAYP